MSLLTSAAPYHIISYGVLLGSEIFNSFIAGIIAYRTLPRPQFAQLQTAQFPIYFAMQTVLPLGLLATAPRRAANIGLGTASTLLPLGISAMGALNWALIGPATTAVMRERKRQETRDGRRSYDPPPHSKAMQELNSRFARLHGASTLINLAAVVATLGYAFEIAAFMV